MDATVQLQKHEKAIKLLAIIKECDRLILRHNKQLETTEPNSHNWYWQRIEINTAIKNRLENYYNKSFKI